MTSTTDRAAARGVILVLLAGVFWSLQGLSIRLIEQASPGQTVFWRSISQGVVLLSVVAAINRGRIVHAFRAAGGAGLVGGLCMLVTSTGFVFALSYTTVANVVFMLACSPLVAALLSWLVMGERVGTRTLCTMLAAAGGIGVMTFESQVTGQFLGNFYAFITMVAFACMAVIVRRGGGIKMLPTSCWGALFTMFVSYQLVDGDIDVSLQDAGMCFISGGVLTATGATLFMTGARYVAAGVLAFLTLTEVVFAPVWVWIGFGEIPSDYTLAGGAIVLTAIVAEAASRALSGEATIAPPRAPRPSLPHISLGARSQFMPIASIVAGGFMLLISIALIVVGAQT